jgi:hypothetical protein
MSVTQLLTQTTLQLSSSPDTQCPACIKDCAKADCDAESIVSVSLRHLTITILPGRNFRYIYQEGFSMRILSTDVEVIDATRIRVVSVIDISEPDESIREPSSTLGEGPTRQAIPDRIVRFLIERGPGSVSISEIQRAIGGNPATINRQAWTLANNAPDLQHRLRGWVISDGRGRYALSVEAINELPEMKPWHTPVAKQESH